jgi:hypothetical protein
MIVRPNNRSDLATSIAEAALCAKDKGVAARMHLMDERNSTRQRCGWALISAGAHCAEE